MDKLNFKHKYFIKGIIVNSEDRKWPSEVERHLIPVEFNLL